jgi:ATP-dependent helicase HrpA
MARTAADLRITYPDLPVAQRREDLLAAIGEHQVVVVAGETGSGKTTQLPKLCLELGRGAIAHTQPRRIAARTVAERIAQELGVGLGEAVGYSVRFDDRSSRDSLVRLLTDGLLLAETQRDPLLRRYDTVIVDEAHERSLNIDFLLGYLHRILPRRPDLKLIITSATIDPERFSRHFHDAPIVEVSGRTYPSRCATATCPRTCPTGSPTPSTSCCASAPATSSCSSAASARSATPRTRCAAATATRSTCCRCTRG